jgi:hypothetical protein
MVEQLSRFEREKRELNQKANEYGNKIATDIVGAIAGPVKFTRTELVAILRTAWLQGQAFKLPYFPLEEELYYVCEECGHEQDEDRSCESCHAEGLVPRTRPYPESKEREKVSES